MVHYLSAVSRRHETAARGRKGQWRLWLAVHALKDASGRHAPMQGLSAARTGCTHSATADQAAWALPPHADQWRRSETEWTRVECPPSTHKTKLVVRARASTGARPRCTTLVTQPCCARPDDMAFPMSASCQAAPATTSQKKLTPDGCLWSPLMTGLCTSGRARQAWRGPLHLSKL